MCYGPTPHADLKGQKQREEELVAHVQSSDCVLEHLIGEVLYNVVEPLGGERGAVRPARWS